MHTQIYTHTHTHIHTQANTPFIEQVPLNEYEFPTNKVSNVQSQLERLVEKNYYLHQSAKDAYRAYLLSYNSHALKDIFNVHRLPMQVCVCVLCVCVSVLCWCWGGWGWGRVVVYAFAVCGCGFDLPGVGMEVVWE